jgi:hypothetical protein|tara:strand:+ start:1107 stop:1715 length:609 start_codon:yes stop_codon:yes gene_type:complete
MSLALFAAEYKEDSNKEEYINRKRETFKRRINHVNKNNKKPSRKAMTTLTAIHSNLEEDENDENCLNNFKPPDFPQSSGVEKTKSRSSEEFSNKNEGFEKMFENTDDKEDVEENEYSTQYYNQYIPPPHLNFNPQEVELSQQNIKNNSGDLDQKLNYLIELIEQQKGEKTEHVTEEILLYGLVGIFVIYVVDSFVTIGKYKR